VPAADKRQRKKDNARMAREARLAADKRRRRMHGARNAAIVAGVFVLGIVLINVVTGSDNKSASSSTTIPSTTPTTVAPPKVKLTGFVADPKKTYTATIGTNFGTIVVALDAKKAPKAAGRFIELARKGYYNEMPWSRAAKDFVIQAGEPSGNPDIVGEVPTNHYPVGAVAAAKKGNDPAGTMDAAFFITTGSVGARLPNDYASFGTVTSGIENAQKIEALAPPASEGGDGPPTKPANITKITISEK
jgi:cyclophilin family peptidyl-prolyl cis-trans isomerase